MGKFHPQIVNSAEDRVTKGRRNWLHDEEGMAIWRDVSDGAMGRSQRGNRRKRRELGGGGGGGGGGRGWRVRGVKLAGHEGVGKNGI